MAKRKKGDCPASSCKKTIPRNEELNSVVRLNVGGVHYEVARDTLMLYEDSMLASLISGKWKEGAGEEIFIDRDGGRFKHILDYLRSDHVYLTDLSDRSALKDEFDYFGIDVDMSKVTTKDNFETISELGKEIKEHNMAIEQKRKKIAAIKESYRLLNEFSKVADLSTRLYYRLDIAKDVDKELLRVAFYLADCSLFVTTTENRVFLLRTYAQLG